MAVSFSAPFRAALLLLAVLLPDVQAQTTGPSFGTVVSVGTTPSDIVLDQGRGRLYLVNSAANRVDVYGIAEKQVIASIAVGTQPISAALAMDGSKLYVTNLQSSSLSVVSLASNGVVATVSLPA